MLLGDRRHLGTRIHLDGCLPLIFSILIQLSPNMSFGSIEERGELVDKIRQLCRRLGAIVSQTDYFTFIKMI